MISSVVRKTILAFITLILILLVPMQGCTKSSSRQPVAKTVPRQADWGIYELDIATQDIRLVYSTPDEIQTSALRLNSAGKKLIFAQKIEGTSDNNLEIYSINIDGSNLRRLTDNSFWDLYPAWSPDGAYIAFLSKRDRDLDIYLMDEDGGNTRKLYDSGNNDADIDWSGDAMVFTAHFAVWRMKEDGTQPVRITNPPGRGEWGQANLPKGDYDPRLSYDGKRLVFERLEDATLSNGGYNFFSINIDGTGEIRLTDNNYAQGIASWSHDGEKIVYVVAAIRGIGKYDLYMMDSDGSNNRNITPDYFPADFLCHAPVFSKDDSKIFFIGQWWK
jgi:Tol biopolymer transport system component